MLDLIFFIAFFVLFISISFKLYVTRKKYIISLSELIQARLDMEIAKEIIQESKNIENSKLDHNENFIKFLSDSRDWAFEYIEDVQNKINKFISDIDPIISYFDKYGNAIHTPQTESMEKISKAYKEIKDMIPSDYGKIE
jgi:hypothetical protein